ncbi:MAG: flagellar hook-length control protein FliK, partial [Rhodobacteraceae bacterium]|nr:flagellar hook-length control protein FliK [Paracoccaceae bacterium]
APQTATPTASAADAKAPPLPITSTSVKRVAPLEQSEARAPQPANAAPISPEPTVSAPGVETALQVTDQAAPQATGVDEPANSGEQPQARPSAPQHPEGAAEALVEPRTLAQQPQPATPTADAAPAQISQAAAPLDESFTPPPDAEAAPKAAAPASSAPTTTTSEAPPAVAAFEAAQKTGAADPALVNANDGEGRFSAGDAPVPGLNSASQSASNDAGLRAATAALTSPETGRSVAAQVASQLSTAAVHRPADNRLELRLDPPELGRVEIEFTFEKDAMKVVVRAEREEALDLMRRHADELARELEEAGLRLGDLSFSAGGFEDQASGDNEDRAALEGLRRGVRPAADPVPHGAIAIDAEARAAMGLAPGRVDLRI